ncbi:Nitrophenylphosphatase-like domain [Phytophthora cactorum]|nr:Nitrophenylphosphatase-like domain [Phytophthora cactorum]
MGYDGLTVSDFGEIGSMNSFHRVARDANEAVRFSYTRTGIDMAMGYDTTYLNGTTLLVEQSPDMPIYPVLCEQAVKYEQGCAPVELKLIEMSLRKLKWRGIGRLELLAWLNEFLQTDYTKVRKSLGYQTSSDTCPLWECDIASVGTCMQIEHLADGIAYCQIFDALYPGKVNLQRLNFQARTEMDRILIEHVVTLQEIPIRKLVQGIFQEHFEFLHWIHDYVHRTYPDAVRSYHGFERRQEALRLSDSDVKLNNTNLIPKYSNLLKTPREGYIEGYALELDEVRAIESSSFGDFPLNGPLEDQKWIQPQMTKKNSTSRILLSRASKSVVTTPRGTDASAQELLEEQLSRISAFFGPEGFAKVKDAFVVVVGLGGVGSHAAHMLARSGVGKLRLVDFDNVTLSSLNRHAVATRGDVGLSKVAAMKRHLHEIVPDCEVEDMAVMFEADSADELLEGNPTYVLDCIDDVKTKSAYWRLEKSVCKLLPLDAEQAQNPEEFGNVENFRIRVIPVLGTMPALFGQSMAAYVLCDLAGKKINPEAVARLSRDQRNKLYQKLQQREHVLFHEGHKIELEKDEIEFVYQEIWRGRSSVSGTRNGGHDRLYLARWRTDRPLHPDNVVYLTTKELAILDKDGIEGFDPEIVARIDARLNQFGSWAHLSDTVSTMATTKKVTQRLTRESFKQWIQGLDAFLFDCDGVLWRGAAPIEGAANMINLLRSLNKRVVFVTNNATNSRATYVKKLASQGITAAEADIVTSAWATVQYMKQHKIEGKVYIVGEAGLKTELELEGYQVSGMEHSDIKGLPHVPDIDMETKAVVCGLDRYERDYGGRVVTAIILTFSFWHHDILQILFVLQDGVRYGVCPSDPWLSLHRHQPVSFDSTYPTDGAIIPGGGSLVNMLECAIGQYVSACVVLYSKVLACLSFVLLSLRYSPPEAVCGKPSQDLLQTIIATYKLDPSRTCMVGDRLSTDIEFGNAGGLNTLLVLTGITHESELGSIENALHVPDHYVDSVDVINQLHAETLEN